MLAAMLAAMATAPTLTTHSTGINIDNDLTLACVVGGLIMSIWGLVSAKRRRDDQKQRVVDQMSTEALITKQLAQPISELKDEIKQNGVEMRRGFELMSVTLTNHERRLSRVEGAALRFSYDEDANETPRQRQE